MSREGEAARAAWARLLGVDRLARFLVIVAESYLCRPGWIGILALDGTVTVSVPRADLRGSITEALGGLTVEDMVRPEVVQPRLPGTRSIRGPAPLFYAPERQVIDGGAHGERVSHDDLDAVFGAAAEDELDESGLLEVDGPVFGSRTPAGELAAVSGYRRWPNDIAHLSVLTSPVHRRRGHGRAAAAAAINHALGDNLLPQWRARPHPSQALARSLGFTELGAQLSFEPA